MTMLRNADEKEQIAASIGFTLAWRVRRRRACRTKATVDAAMQKATKHWQNIAAKP